MRAILTLCCLASFGLASPGGAKPQATLQKIPEKLVVLTFDDGNVSDLTTVAPILTEHGFGATFYITSGWVGRTGRMTWEQVKELAAAGLEPFDVVFDPNNLSNPNDDYFDHLPLVTDFRLSVPLQFDFDEG